VRRPTFLFLVILAAGAYLWPWLREIGLFGLPGDTVTDLQGYRLHLPIGTALLISAAISGVWWLLDPR
jgi:hypothetical protein